MAALLGSGGTASTAGTAMAAAEIVFLRTTALFLISAVFGVLRGRSPSV